MNLIDQFRHITTFVFDVDGVLTDGTVYVFDNGDQVRRMSIKDGFSLQLAIKKGYRVLVISGANSPAVVSRLTKLGLTDILMNIHDKRSVLLQYMNDHNIAKEKILFMGDDIPDFVAMNIAGLPCAPSDAVPEIKKAASYISSKPGGKGCVREVIEKVLKLNGHWELETDIASR
jgi:3-deoxy-D-manno-octulosonate 8-phosphate phosphatase (KDO 8-P phosphatase)